MPSLPLSPDLLGLAAGPIHNAFSMGHGGLWSKSLGDSQDFQQMLDDAFEDDAAAPVPEAAREDKPDQAMAPEEKEPVATAEAAAAPQEVLAPVAATAIWSPALAEALAAANQASLTNPANQSLPALVTAPLAELAAMLQQANPAAQASQPTAPLTAEALQAQAANPQTLLSAATGEKGALQLDGLALQTVTPMDGLPGNVAKTLDQLQPASPWSNLTLGQNQAEAMIRERITVLPVVEPGVLAGQPLPGATPVLATPPADLPAPLATPDPQGSGLLPPPQEQAAHFSMAANGFANGFTENSGLLPTNSVPLSGQGGGSAAQAGNSRPVLTSKITEFPDMVASELGRTRIVTRPNQSEQIRIQLEPLELGELDMQVRVGVDRQVHMMITTESESTKEALQRQMGQLRESLASQNLSMGEVQVEVGARNSQGEAWRHARQQDHSANRSSAAFSASERTAATAPPPRRGSVRLAGGGISIHA